MQQEYAAGDAVVVFDGSHWRAQAEHGDPQAPDGTAGVVVRDVTQLERVYDPRANHGQGAYVDGGPILPRVYEVRFADGHSAHVSVEHMASPAQLAAAQAVAHATAVAEAQAASDHAQALSDSAVALRQAHAKQQKVRSSK